MKPKRYFSAESAHGSESSHGFSNDTIVRVFSSKPARDEYVASSRNLSCQAISAKDATKYATNWSMTFNRNNTPQPFSNEFWAVVESFLDEVMPNGCIGRLECFSEGNGILVERFYR